MTTTHDPDAPGVYRSEIVTIEEPTEAPRDRYLDVLLTAALAAVVVLHVSGEPELSTVLPAMGLLYALGGSWTAAALERPAAEAIGSGLRRVVPSVWAMALVMVPAMVWAGWPTRPGLKHLALWLVPVLAPPTSAWGRGAGWGLVGVVAFLWLVFLSPLLRWLYRHGRLLALVAPFGLLWASDHLLGSAPPRAGAVVTGVLTYASCWLLGVARRRGDLRRVRWRLIIPIAVAATAAGVAWTVAHPAAGPFDLARHPVAHAVYSFGVALVLLRAAPAMDGLRRHPALDRIVSSCAARPVTIYLWHGVVVILSLRVAALLPEDDMGIVWQVAAFAAIVVAVAAGSVLLFGWVEDMAARRPVRLLPWTEVPARRPRREIPEWSGPIWFE